MSDCPDLSVLADVEAAADYRALALLEHVRTCAECRAALADVETVHDAMAVASPLDEPRVEAIVAAMRADAEPSERRPRQGALYTAVLFVLALLTSGLLVAAIAIISPEPPSPWLAAALMVGASVLLTRAGAARPAQR